MTSISNSVTCSYIERLITARERDLGGFSVRRILPYMSHRMVGPFIFFDHMGPAHFSAGNGIDVRPHPHINLATVTYLFDGRIHHRDSLGSDQLIEPGAINWMIAGRGIVHSERTPLEEKTSGYKLNGIQLWVALPEKDEETEPSFSHHPKDALPEFAIGGVEIKLLLGKLFEQKSPVPIHSDLFYAEVKMKKGNQLLLPVEGRESAIYVVDGKIKIGETSIDKTTMAIGKTGVDLPIEALEDSRMMLIGGEPLGKRLIYWNFVSSSKERLDEAKSLWAQGPNSNNPRFQPIPGDDKEFIPLPQEVEQPKGTIM